MGCDIHMWLEKYTDEEDLYINSIIDDLDEYTENDNEALWKYGSSEFSSISKIKGVIKQENRDSNISTVLNLNLEKRWIVIGEPYDDRNYTLFAKLAGVRSDGDYRICKPRGVPDDSSLFYQIKVNQWMGDGHSHSYFSISELLEHDFSNISENFTKFIEGFKNKEDINNYRIVFFFDN